MPLFTSIAAGWSLPGYVILAADRSGMSGPTSWSLCSTKAFLFYLPFYLPVHTHFHNERVTFARRGSNVVVHGAQSFLERTDSSFGSFLLFVDRTLKVSSETLNLFDLLLKIAPQAH